MADEQKSIAVTLVAAGQYHDIDYARLEILKLLAEDERIRTRVVADYHDVDALTSSDFIVSYTCNLVPEEDEQQALKSYIEGGGRWLALHGTNAILQFTAEGVATPETAPVLMETLGTQFIAHPPIAPYRVELTQPEHPLVTGIEPFDTDDELYLCRIHGDLDVLMHTHFTGDATGFVEADWPNDEPRPVYYVNSVGAGQVLYLTLGHCRGHYDMQPVMDFYPTIERGSWEVPEYYELLRRAIAHCANGAT